MNEFSKTLIYFGVVLIGIGVLAGVFSKIPGLGRLPGDFYVHKGNFRFYFPFTTCLLLSLLLTLILSLFGKR